jgi:prepilin-type N-terminal cleavage/methylation domain-containing protein
MRNQKGFTLVELLVVIAIIGVLATLVLLQLGTARGRARDTKRIADINQIRGALEQYYEDNNGTYPAGITDPLIGQYFSSGKVPKDPLTDAAYYYAVDGVKFQIATELENKAAALNSDSDLTSADVTGAKNGAAEACTTAADDCIYDQGSK